MITHLEVNETNNMIEHENLDVRTITLGISLLDCCDSDLEKLNEKIYNKITTLAKDLVPTGKQIERDFGIPIVNKRISVTPIALVGGAACKEPGGLCDDCKDPGPCGKDCRRQLYRRIFRSCIQGHDNS